jgi:putative transposase
MEQERALPTIWEAPDELWVQVEAVLLRLDPPRSKGRKRVDPRPVLNGIIHRLRTGCQWNQVPERFGDDSTLHRTFQRWVNCGVLSATWGTLIEGCEELGGVDWEWQAADGAMGKARLGGTRWGPTPRTGRRRAPRRASLWKREEGP